MSNNLQIDHQTNKKKVQIKHKFTDMFWFIYILAQGGHFDYFFFTFPNQVLLEVTYQ